MFIGEARQVTNFKVVLRCGKSSGQSKDITSCSAKLRNFLGRREMGVTLYWEMDVAGYWEVDMPPYREMDVSQPILGDGHDSIPLC